jgi:hypothetical protein
MEGLEKVMEESGGDQARIVTKAGAHTPPLFSST